MKILRALILTLCIYLLVAAPCYSHAQQADTKGQDIQALQQKLDALQQQVAELQGQIKKLGVTDSAAPVATSQQETKGQNTQQQKKASEASEEIKTRQAAGTATLNYQTD